MRPGSAESAAIPAGSGLLSWNWRLLLRRSLVLLPIVLLMAQAVRAEVPPGFDESTEVTVRWQAGSVDTTIAEFGDSLQVRLAARWIDVSSADLRWVDRGTRAESPPLARGVDYLLDPRRGKLRLLASPPPGQDLRVRLRSFPIQFPTTFGLHRPWFPADSVATGPLAADPGGGWLGRTGRSDPLSEARLDIAGSKTFSVQVGSQQDLSLEQSLDLSINGRIGRNVTVRAVLTDRDTPLQPEGTSAQLQDLDRVLVEVEGPRARMRLGDFETALRPTPFTDYRRQLAGVEGAVDTGPVRFQAMGATSPGTFLSREFLGVEGVQGPYTLQRDVAGLSDPIVAGSETIWIDGRKLTRGEDSDYIIDYAAGELTFTSRNPITAYSRVAVDFQVADRPYEGRVYRTAVESGSRSLLDGAAMPPQLSTSGRVGPVGGTVGGSVGGPAGHGAGDPRSDGLETAVSLDWLVERDAANEPIRFDLTDEERAILRDAGDEADTLGQGIRFVGAGNGDYELVYVDTLAAPFFVFRGPGEGDFLVRFVQVGPGEGDYADSAFVDSTMSEVPYFVFVGRDEGDYLPARELVAPESRALFALRTVTAWGDRVSLVADAAVSDYDRNTLSTKDDGDNLGAAVELRSAWSLLSRGPTELGIDVTFRNVDPKFEPLGRLEESFFGLDWNLDPARLASGDRRVSVATRLRHGRQGLRLELGRLDNTADFRSNRAVVEASGVWRSIEVDGRVLRARSEDDLRAGGGVGVRARDAASIRRRGGWISSQVRYAAERSEVGRGLLRNGSFFREFAGHLGSGSRFTSVRADLEYTERRTYDVQGGDESPRDTGRTARGELEWRGGGGRSVAAGYTRRILTPAVGGAGRTSELGTFRWLLRGGEGYWRQEGRWELSTQEDRERIRVLEFVGEGKGHYDSLGVYQGVGDYEVLIRESDDPIRRNRIDWSSRTELDRGRGGGGEEGESPSLLGQAWRELRVVHYWTAAVETSREVSYLWSRMFPVLWGSERLERVDIVQRADVTTLDGVRFLAPRLGFVLRRTETGGEGGIFERVSSRGLTLRLRSRPADRWSADLEGELERDHRTFTASGNETRTGWNTRGLRAEQSVRLRRGLSLEIDAGYRHRARVESAERADVFLGSPAVVFTPQPRSRVELKTERTSVTRRGAVGRAGRELERSGWDSRLLSTIRLREALDLTFFFHETRPDRGRRLRDLRLELRATF